jgi:hypothetical protein
MLTSRKKYVFFIITILIFSILLVRYLQRVPRRHYCDFRVYHHTAEKFLARQDIYKEDAVVEIPFKYSPSFAFATSPIGLLPIKAAAGVFFALNFFATIAFFYFIRKFIISDVLSYKQSVLIYSLTAVVLFRAILFNNDSGQVMILMGALTAISLYSFSRKKVWVGAMTLAAAILVKYTPVIIIPYLIARKKIKAAVLSILFVVLWLFLPALYSRPRVYYSYLTSWIPSIVNNSLDKQSYFDYMNQSIYSFVLRLTSAWEYNVNWLSLDFHTSMSIAYLFAFILYLLVLLPAKNKKDADKLDYCLLFLCIPLFNPNSRVLNFISLGAAFMYFFYRHMTAKVKDSLTTICLTVAILLFSFWGRSLVGEALEYTSEVASFTTLATLVLFLALCRLKYRTENTGIC